MVYSSGSVFAQKLLFGHVRAEEGGGGGEAQGEGSEAAAGRKRSIDDAAGPAGGEAEGKEPPSKKVATEGDDGLHAEASEEVAPMENTNSNSADAQTSGLATEDLQYLISDWYDTTNAGPKKEKASYEKIADALKVSQSMNHVRYIPFAALCSYIIASSCRHPVPDGQRGGVRCCCGGGFGSWPVGETGQSTSSQGGG